MAETPNWLDGLSTLAGELHAEFGSAGDRGETRRPRLVLIEGDADRADIAEAEPTTAELIEALSAPGPLHLQPSVRRLQAARERHAAALACHYGARPNLTLVGGDDAA